MRIEDSFRVNVPLEEAWKVLLDVERIAPCMPGAELQEVEGDEYRGIVKVKVGPITAQYKGAARLDEVDEPGRRIVLKASGRDTRGQGNASATVVAALRPDGDGTLVGIDTDLTVTGKVAQFGRGVLAEVSSKLLAQFVDNLERDVLGAGAAGADLAGEAAADTAAEVEALAATAPAAGPRRIDSKPAEPVDLLAVGGTPVARRLLPVALGALVLVLVVAGLRRRRRRRAG